MKNKNIEALVQTLEKRNKAKRDFVVPASKIYVDDDNEFLIRVENEDFYFNSTDLFESQIAEKLGIPLPYFRRMKEKAPNILQDNINGWFDYAPNKKYMVRAFETTENNTNVGRAFLSDSYNIIDDYDVLFAALEAIKQTGVNVDITRADVSDTRLYLHVTCPEIEVNAESFLKEYLKNNDAAGNGIISGFVLTNSEVGKGAFEIRPRAVICKCNNGLIVKDERFRRVHLGSKLDAGEIVWSDATRKKNKDLIISQVSDAVKTYLSPQYLGTMIEKIAQLNDIKLQHPIDAVQNVCKHLSIDEKHKNEILQYFLKDQQENTAGSLLNAVTREAQNMDLDSQYEIESNVVELMFKHKSYDKPFSKN